MPISGFAEVIAAAQEGSEWAWGILVRDVSPSLAGFFRVRGAADPEGLTGDVLIDVARNIGSFKGDSDGFRSWVFVIAYRRLTDDWRRRSRRVDEKPSGLQAESNASVPSAEAEALDSLGHDEAMRMLGVLTPDQRDVIALRIVAGLTLEETARVIGKSVGSVKALQSRGIAALRRDIGTEAVSK